MTQKRPAKPKHKKGRKEEWKVSFLKKRSLSFTNSLRSFKQKYFNNSAMSPSSKKEALSKLFKILWFDQVSQKRYLNKLKKFVHITLKVDISTSISWIVRSYEEAALNNGPIEAVKLFKQLHDIYLRLITSNDFFVDPYISTNSSGEPKLLGPLLELSKGSLNERRAGLHAIQIIKLVGVWPKEASFKTITKQPPIPMIKTNQLPQVGGYLSRAVDSITDLEPSIDFYKLIDSYKYVIENMFPSSERNVRLRALRKFSDIHISSRNGPNGPCLTTVVLDHYCLNKEFPLIYLSIRELALVTNNGSLLNYIIQFDEEDYLTSSSKDELPALSKISLKRESWGKLRPFAVCDWFSQSACKGLHKFIFEFLKTLPSDGTFNQDLISETVREWTTGSGEPESADLSAATDSIPVEVQSEILSHIFSPEIARLWRVICTDREFKLPDKTNTLKYTTGQPMGILSSWAMLAVWHHVMVRTCLHYIGVKEDLWNGLYAIIGDDVSMNGSSLFLIYKELVGKLQGVGISKVKGFHKETQNHRNPIIMTDNTGVYQMKTAEFAKRIFCGGQEITVIPPDELFNSFEDATQFPELVFNMSKRGYPDRDIDIPSLTSLCRHKKLALILVTNPLRPCPNWVTEVLKGSVLYKDIPWYKPWFSIAEFKIYYVETLQRLLISTLASLLTEINQWIYFSLQEGEEIRVKGWSYKCYTQLLLIRNIAQILAGKLADCSDRISDLGDMESTQDYWSRLKAFVSSLEVIFEFQYLFKEKSIFKETSKGYRTNTLLSKILRTAVSDMEPKGLKRS